MSDESKVTKEDIMEQLQAGHRARLDGASWQNFNKDLCIPRSGSKQTNANATTTTAWCTGKLPELCGTAIGTDARRLWQLLG